MNRLDHYWYSQNLVAWLLLPLSWLFCVVSMLRRFMYVNGMLPAHSMSVPVVIIGNISVGGTGKTPLLIALCEYLCQQGFRPGVVSRGYGAAMSGRQPVSVGDDAVACGDEPVLIKQRTGCPVVIGSDRVAAAKMLLAENDCDVILSDDGLQHYRLKRDIEIAVVDTKRRFGNGFCLPAGPLREPVTRLRKVNMIVHHGDTDDIYRFSLEFEEAVNLSTGKTRNLDLFAGVTVHALAGIGHPDRFFNQLRTRGIELIEHALPDHHAYTRADIEFADHFPILMTEKDAVKSQRLLPDMKTGDAIENIWAVPVSAKISDKLGADLIGLIKQRS
jgi:tetraacyldisaccharide 4'-kinase